MSKILRWKAAGPWITRDLKDAVLARDYDALAARLAEAERLLRGVARGGYPAGMAALLQDITQYFRASEPQEPVE